MLLSFLYNLILKVCRDKEILQKKIFSPKPKIVKRNRRGRMQVHVAASQTMTSLPGVLVLPVKETRLTSVLLRLSSIPVADGVLVVEPLTVYKEVKGGRVLEEGEDIAEGNELKYGELVRKR